MTLPRSPHGRLGGGCLEAGLRATPSLLALVLDLFLGYWFNVCCAVHKKSAQSCSLQINCSFVYIRVKNELVHEISTAELLVDEEPVRFRHHQENK